MAPHELNVLDYLQGGVEKERKTGIKSYSHLEHLLKNPHIKKKIYNKSRESHAAGSQVGESLHQKLNSENPEMRNERMIDLILEKLRNHPGTLNEQEVSILEQFGRNGDRTLAAIGPETKSLFDKMARNKTKNPNTGLPEYWSLQDVLGKLGSVLHGAWEGAKKHAPGFLNSAAQAAVPHLTKMATDQIDKRFGTDSPMSGALGSLAQMGGGLASTGVNALAGGKTHRYGERLGDAAGYMADMASQGQTGKRALGHGFDRFGQNLGGKTGNALTQVGQNMQRGQGFRQAGRQVMQQQMGQGPAFAGNNARQNMLPAAINGLASGTQHYLSQPAGNRNLARSAGMGLKSASQNFNGTGLGDTMNAFGSTVGTGGNLKTAAQNAGRTAYNALVPKKLNPVSLPQLQPNY